MTMPDGRRLNLATKSGAEDYVATFPTFASLNCGQLLRPDIPEDMKIQIVMILGVVAENMTEETFTGLELEGKRTVARTLKALLKPELKKGSRFRRTGKLGTVAQELLEAVVVWCKDSAFTDAMVAEEGNSSNKNNAGSGSLLGMAAQVSAASASPSEPFVYYLMDTCRNFAITRARRPDPKDRSLSDMEPSGILREVGR